VRTLVAAALVSALCAPVAIAREFVATEADFQCVKEWPKPEGHKARIFNRSKRRLKKAIRVLLKGKKGLRYPIGTIIELVPPNPRLHLFGEVSVKRGGKFNREGNGWEFFVIDARPDGSTVILKRGGPEVANIGIPCQTCHSAAKDFDFVCESEHGCIPLNLSAEGIAALQNLDPRCPAAP